MENYSLSTYIFTFIGFCILLLCLISPFILVALIAKFITMFSSKNKYTIRPFNLILTVIVIIIFGAVIYALSLPNIDAGTFSIRHKLFLFFVMVPAIITVAKGVVVKKDDLHNVVGCVSEDITSDDESIKTNIGDEIIEYPYEKFIKEKIEKIRTIIPNDISSEYVELIVSHIETYCLDLAETIFIDNLEELYPEEIDFNEEISNNERYFKFYIQFLAEQLLYKALRMYRADIPLANINFVYIDIYESVIDNLDTYNYENISKEELYNILYNDAENKFHKQILDMLNAGDIVSASYDKILASTDTI